MKKSQTRPRTKPAADAPITETRQPDEYMARLAASRVAIENVSPEVNAGRFPAKACAGDRVVIEADVFCDGHDKIDAAVLFRRAGASDWMEAPMAVVENDRWRGSFTVEENARYQYTIIAWRDLFASWRDEVSKKHAAGVPISLELTEGRMLVAAAAEAAGEAHPGRAGLAELLAE